MKTPPFRLIALTVVCFAAALTAPGQGIKWMTDFDAARKVAETAGKPMMVVFRCEP